MSGLVIGFGVGTTTVFRYVREGFDVLAAMAPTMQEALDVARRKAFVILDAGGAGGSGRGVQWLPQP